MELSIWVRTHLPPRHPDPDVRRCVECGRPYRGGLTGPALLELALDEVGDGALKDEHIRDLLRVRKLLRRVDRKLDTALSEATDRLSSSGR